MTTLPPRTLLVLLALAGCARGGTPDTGCEAQVNRDPAVRDLIIKGLGNEHFRWESDDLLNQTRQRARIACLQGRGVLRGGGGVEPQNPM